jgi:hypothetical protein
VPNPAGRNSLAEHGERRAAGYILRSRKLTSNNRLDPEYMKEVSADALLLNIFHPPGCEKIHARGRAEDRALQKGRMVTHYLPLPSILTRLDAPFLS